MIAFESVCLRTGTFALEGVSLHISEGTYGVLMGKTGSGKTSMLEALCGLRPVQSGRILIAGRDVTRVRPGARDIGYVPQDGALFPTLPVREQLEFGLRARGWTRGDRRARIGELAAGLGLEELLHRMPAGLSGGERQRVALGRALAFYPRVLCLDEPLAALDDETRTAMMELLEQVRAANPVTTLHVTHNRGEAERLADRVFALADGRICALTP